MATAAACYFEKLPVPLAISAAVIPMLGIRRLGLTGAVLTLAASHGLYTYPRLNSAAMAIFQGCGSVVLSLISSDSANVPNPSNPKADGWGDRVEMFKQWLIQQGFTMLRPGLIQEASSTPAPSRA